MDNTLAIIEFLLIVLAILGGLLEWQVIRGNRLVGGTKELLDEIKRQQNENAQILEDRMNHLLNQINKDIEKTADINYQLSQNLRESKVNIDATLKDLRQTNFQLLAKIEVLDKKVENGNGHGKSS